MINFLSNAYDIIKELESCGDTLRSLIDNHDRMTGEPYNNWEANASFYMTQINNNILYLKNRLLEFDNAINGADDFTRDGSERRRTELLS